MSGATRKAILIFWGLLQLVGLVCAGIFVSGVVRNAGTKDIVVPLDLSQAAGPRQVAFRLWHSGRYTLYLTTVNHDPTFVGEPFAGSMRVRLTDANHATVVDRTFGEETIHRIPANMEWTTLQVLEIDRTSVRPWLLEASVLRPDSRFAGMFSRVLLKKYEADEGWSALVALAMSVPAAVLSFFALVLAVAVQVRGGPAVPTVVSLSCLLLLLAGWIASSTL